MFLPLGKPLYNIPDNVFNGELYMSYLYFPIYRNSGYVSISGGNASDFSKTVSMKKSYSEYLERSGLFVSTFKNRSSEKCFNLINRTIEDVSRDLLGYSSSKVVASDTTGTSFSQKSSNAIIKAIEELFEKNSLFLFWYCKKAKIIQKNIIDDLLPISIKRLLIYKKISYLFFQSPSIGMIKTVVCILLSKKNIYIGSGCSGSIYVEKAIVNSITESISLLWDDEVHGKIIDISERKQITKYLTDIYNLSGESQLEKSNFVKMTEQEILTNIINSLPKWIKSLNVALLPKADDFPYASGVKIFSNDLFNCLPQKKFINLNKRINTEYAHLTENEFYNCPELPIM